jgi:hypothetical protein
VRCVSGVAISCVFFRILNNNGIVATHKTSDNRILAYGTSEEGRAR